MSRHLYHGSGYKQTELKPSYMYTGEIVRWDKTESNEWLYATVSMEEAITQGLASVVEKTWKLSRFKSDGRKLTFQFDGKLPTVQEIAALSVYLYKIDWIKELWVKVNNVHNGMDNEYKTKEIIGAGMIDSCEPVNLKEWLKGKEVVIVPTSPAMRWAK